MVLYGINTLKQKKNERKNQDLFSLSLGLYNGRIMIESMEPEIFGQNLLFESESLSPEMCCLGRNQLKWEYNYSFCH